MTGTNGGPEQDESGTRGGYVPFRVDTGKPPVESERIPLFYIGEQEYTGPERVSASTALRALEIASSKGNAAAAYHCLIDSIGEEAYRALIDCPQVTFAQAQDLLTKITEMYFGQAVGIAGK